MNGKIISTLALSLIVVFGAIFSAAAQQPNFSPAIWADGELCGTKGTTPLPLPTERTMHSFDKLFVIVNSNNPEGQLPVSEAAPGNRYYNGGRWYTHTVEWTEDGFLDHGIVPVLKSYGDVMEHYDLGHLAITAGSFPGGPMISFQCPLLPVKNP